MYIEIEMLAVGNAWQPRRGHARMLSAKCWFWEDGLSTPTSIRVDTR